MRRAFDRQWTPGEPRLMADLLADLGPISQAALAEEQVRQLEALHRQAEAGSIDRLHIAHALARSHWNYSRPDAAIDLLESALDEYQTACDGVLPADANGALDRLIGYLESRKHFARGERLLFSQLERPANQQQVFWLRQRLYRLYEAAIGWRWRRSRWAKACGLYQAATKQLRDELDTTDHNHRYQLVNRLCSIYRSAKSKSFDNVLADLRDFAFGQLPEVLKLQTNNYQSIVSQVAQTLEQVGGPRDGLGTADRADRKRASLVAVEQSRRLEPALAPIGLLARAHRRRIGRPGTPVAEDRRRRTAPRSDNRPEPQSQLCTTRHGSYFWSEQGRRFRSRGRGSLRERKDSASGVAYIADYCSGAWSGTTGRSRCWPTLIAARSWSKAASRNWSISCIGAATRNRSRFSNR
jgi:hypothetical protein